MKQKRDIWPKSKEFHSWFLWWVYEYLMTQKFGYTLKSVWSCNDALFFHTMGKKLILVFLYLYIQSVFIFWRFFFFFFICLSFVYFFGIPKPEIIHIRLSNLCHKMIKEIRVKELSPLGSKSPVNNSWLKVSLIKLKRKQSHSFIAILSLVLVTNNFHVHGPFF